MFKLHMRLLRLFQSTQTDAMKEPDPPHPPTSPVQGLLQLRSKVLRLRFALFHSEAALRW